MSSLLRLPSFLKLIHCHAWLWKRVAVKLWSEAQSSHCLTLLAHTHLITTNMFLARMASTKIRYLWLCQKFRCPEFHRGRSGRSEHGMIPLQLSWRPCLRPRWTSWCSRLLINSTWCRVQIRSCTTTGLESFKTLLRNAFEKQVIRFVPAIELRLKHSESL